MVHFTNLLNNINEVWLGCGPTICMLAFHMPTLSLHGEAKCVSFTIESTPWECYWNWDSVIEVNIYDEFAIERKKKKVTV